MKTLVSWNVNGIRACVGHGFVEWLTNESPDIVCLQEIKAQETQFPAELLDKKNIYNFFVYPAQKAGYSGVCVLSKEKPINVKFGLDIEKFDFEGRLIICEYKNYILYNGYYPNGQRDHGRVDFKLEFSEAVLQHALKSQKKLKKPAILCGDFNTAHHAIDLANPKTNTKTTGFLPNERAWMDRLLEHGFHDVFREENPDENGHYTWWTYRSNCRAKNVGWRIDYFMVSSDIRKKIKEVGISKDVMGSDHCPIYIKIK